MSELKEDKSTARKAAAWAFIAGAALFSFIVFRSIATAGITNAHYYSISIVHFPAVIGLPFAAIASLFIVLTCEIVSKEKMSFSMVGFKFEGSSGQVVLFVFCFTAMAWAIGHLWDKKFDAYSVRVSTESTLQDSRN